MISISYLLYSWTFFLKEFLESMNNYEWIFNKFDGKINLMKDYKIFRKIEKN